MEFYARIMDIPEFAQAVFDNVQRIPFPDKEGQDLPVTYVMINGQLTMIGTFASVLAHLMDKHGYSVEEGAKYLVAAFGLKKVEQKLFDSFKALWRLILAQPTTPILIEIVEEELV